MKIPFMDLKRLHEPLLDKINHAIQSTIETSAFIGGDEKNQFEQEFAQFCGSQHCVGVGNGTDALFLSLKTLRIGVGDEVITAANSFIASSESITMTGARPVFIDCDRDTYNMDLDRLEDLTASRGGKVKAILPVHLYGRAVDMPRLMSIANKHNLSVVEDAAQAHGAKIDGQSVGSFGHLACFSFYPGKNLGAFGDAGAVVSSDDNLAKKVRMLCNHGRIGKYDHEFEGYNSRLDGLQAAILRVKLKALREQTDNRIQLAQRYNEALSDLGGQLILPSLTKNDEHVFHLYVVRTEKRDELKQHLQKNGISTGVHYPIALPNLKAYSYLNHKASDFPNASEFQQQILSLPLFPGMTAAEQDYVTDTVKGFFK